MEMAKEDLLDVRRRIAETGMEMTPDEVLDILQEVKPELSIVNEPGLVTELKRLKNNEN